MAGQKEKQATIWQLISWSFFEWANSSYAAVIQTFVFASYFTRSVAPNEVKGSCEWGYALGFAGVLVALGGPILGAIADHKGNRKQWIFFFFLICLISIALLWYVQPQSSYVPMALFLVALGSIASEFAFIFYNAMLPNLVSKSYMGTWSGIGWGMGYVGGLFCLFLSLFAFLNQQDSWWILDEKNAEPIRATFLLTAIWYGIFSIPIFLFTPDVAEKKETLSRAIVLGLNELKSALKNIYYSRHLLWFLLARMIYTDGLTTLFLFGGVYAAGAFQMSAHDVLVFGISLNITAGMGAFAFAWYDDFAGSKKVIVISLVSLIIITSILLIVESLTWFWIFGLLLGIFVGPLQSSSRSLMAKVTPKGKESQMFGLFAFSGKATGFLGPLFVSMLTSMTGSQRLGLSILIPFFIFGLVFIFKVPSEENFHKPI